jgi:hypothetical protein
LTVLQFCRCTSESWSAILKNDRDHFAKWPFSSLRIRMTDFFCQAIATTRVAKMNGCLGLFPFASLF